MVRRKMEIGKWEIRWFLESTGHFCQVLEILSQAGVFVETLTETLLNFTFALASLFPRIYLVI